MDMVLPREFVIYEDSQIFNIFVYIPNTLTYLFGEQGHESSEQREDVSDTGRR